MKDFKKERNFRKCFISITQEQQRVVNFSMVYGGVECCICFICYTLFIRNRSSNRGIQTVAELQNLGPLSKVNTDPPLGKFCPWNWRKSAMRRDATDATDFDRLHDLLLQMSCSAQTGRVEIYRQLWYCQIYVHVFLDNSAI